MQRTNVSSSNIAIVGYDLAKSLLEITFNDGSVYEYYSVPEGVYSGLMSAASHGRYFHANIRDSYQYAKVG